jgi:hypothetical protein
MEPLNGTKTHPLSAHALDELRGMARGGPVPLPAINPGVRNRLLREALVEVVQRKSPFKAHKGREIDHLAITDAGRAALQQEG